MEIALRALLPKLLGPVPFSVHPFQGKTNLLKNLEPRLRAYAKSLPASHRVLVCLDRDAADCLTLKEQLEEAARKAGLVTKSAARGRAFKVINRIAVEELEAWFFGDWEAVRQAYPKVDARLPAKKSFRDPDAIKGGTWESLERVLQKAGYFKAGIRKLDLARTVGPLLQPARNQSRSFRLLCAALQGL